MHHNTQKKIVRLGKKLDASAKRRRELLDELKALREDIQSIESQLFQATKGETILAKDLIVDWKTHSTVLPAGPADEVPKRCQRQSVKANRRQARADLSRSHEVPEGFTYVEYIQAKVTAL